MNCPFLINENKVITSTISSINDNNPCDKTAETHERWMAPCMGNQCFYYKTHKDNYNNLIVECTRIDRRKNLGKA